MKENIDLRTCKEGDILISSQGAILKYISPTPYKHYVYLEHVVQHLMTPDGELTSNGSLGTRTHDGFVFRLSREPNIDHDIVKIIKKEDLNSFIEKTNKSQKYPSYFNVLTEYVHGLTPKLTTLAELVDKEIGLPGTPKRDKYDRKLNFSLLGDDIRRLRRIKGLTQVELAKQLGVDRVTILNLEKNPANCSIKKLSKVLNVLGGYLHTEIITSKREEPVEKEPDYYWCSSCGSTQYSEGMCEVCNNSEVTPKWIH